MKPYAILSDLHLHLWSAFSHTLPSGLNNRLSGLLSEIDRASKVLKAAGGDTMFFAGDMFHVRGSIAPSVLNPTMDVFRQLVAEGFIINIIPGNHDLEGKHSDRLGSAITSLEGIGCNVAHESTGHKNVVLVPWIDKVEDLKANLLDLAKNFGKPENDLIIHAPVNGVIMGIPDHGLEPAWLAALGFKRVFSGHYHNHKEFPGRVYSIGALAHHTWSDVGTQAGFLIVHDEQVDFHPSVLPQFIDANQPGITIEEIKARVKGNFARVKINSSKMADVEAMRELLTEAGALGTTVISVKAAVDTRSGSIAASVRAGASIEQSVSEFIKGMQSEVDKGLVERLAMQVLAEVETT